VDNNEIWPSRWYYVLAGVIFVAGWVYFGVYLFSNLSGMGKKLQQVVVPGQSDITLREAGHYTIFHEYNSVVGNKIYSTEQKLSGLEVTLASKATGTSVPMRATASTGNYEFDGRAGVAVLEFDIHNPGVYQLSASYPAGHPGPEVVLAVGHNFTMEMVSAVLGSLGIIFSSLAISLFLVIFTVIKRAIAKRRLKVAGQSPITPVKG
jgi:hypothetical protein